MTNVEKYKTTNDRVYAFRKYCRDKGTCHGCALNETGVSRTICVDRCILNWLALEAEEEKPLPCPFCDYPSPYLHNDGERWLVDCGACGAQIFRATRESAIAAWNRRAK